MQRICIFLILRIPIPDFVAVGEFPQIRMINRKNKAVLFGPDEQTRAAVSQRNTARRVVYRCAVNQIMIFYSAQSAVLLYFFNNAHLKSPYFEIKSE